MTTDPSPDPLAPYVPRIAARWLDEHASARHQAIEGSLVSADISGFTNLSERLAERGRAGAEEMVAVINGCFEEMISAAVHYGGDILKFGGDALLILFEGDDHARRAAVASAEIRHVVSQPRPSPTAGPIDLSMSIGLHSGSFDLFLGRGLHAELIITGPAATATIRCESDAEAGQILASAAAVELLPMDWRDGEVQSDGRCTISPPMGQDDLAAPAPAVPTEHLAALVPRTLLDHLDQGGLQGEVRPVTTAFIAFSGMDDAIATQGPRRVARTLEGLVEVVSQACDAYNIHWLDTDIAPDGGKIHLTAGAPTATADDDGAMLHAVRAILDTCPDPPLAAGVNHGNVFVGDVGAPTRRTLAAMGDSVNLAARLCGKAEVGQLVATLEVIEGAATLFDAEPLPSFRVKGKARPVMAGLVGAPADTSLDADHDAPEGVEAPLLARETELASLRDALGRAGAGDPQVVLLRGPGGIGKTRLASELRRVAAGVRVLASTCDPYQSSAPFVPFRDLMQQTIGIDAGIDPVTAGGKLLAHVHQHAPELLPWIPLLAMPLGASVATTPEADRIAPAFRRLRLQQSITDFLRACLTTPTVIVLEDVEWLDNASRDLLADLLLGMFDRPWCLVLTGTALDETETDSDVLQLDVPGLADGALRQLAMHALADTPILDHELDRLIANAAGHPLFLLEMVSEVRENGAVGALPRTIEAAVTSRLDALAPADLTLLRQAAVVGPESPLAMLAEVVGPEAGAPSRWEPMSGFVDVTEGQLRFREPLYQQVAYDGTSYAVRAALHATAADYLEASSSTSLDTLAARARHEDRSGRHERAWHACVAAAGAMRDQWAILPAVEHFERALANADHLPDLDTRDVSRVAEFLGDVAEIASLHERAIAAFEKSLEVAVDDIQAARLLQKMAESQRNMGSFAQAEASIERGLDLMSNQTSERADVERGRLSIERARLRFRQGKFSDVADWTARAAESLRFVREVPPLLEAQRAFVAASGLMAADPELAAAGLSEALQSYHAAGDLVGQGRCENNLGVVYYYLGNWSEALGHYKRAASLFSQAGYMLGAAMTAFNFGEICAHQNRHAEAMTWLEEARRRYRSTHNRFGVASSTSFLGWVKCRAGDGTAGIDSQRVAVEELMELGAANHAMAAMVRLAESLLHAGEVTEAIDLLDDVLADNPPVTIATSTYRIRGQAHERMGEERLAEESFRVAYNLALQEDLGHEAALAAMELAARGATGDESLDPTSFARLAKETLSGLGIRDA